MFYSIIIPVYCTEPFLRQCVRSVLEQTCADFELILVDDGSTDGSSELCDAYAAEDPRVRVIHQQNRGASAARNAGIRMARGRYLLLADSDDYYPSKTMLAELAELIAEKNADLLLFEIEAWDQRSNRFRLRYGPFNYDILDRFDHRATLEYLFSQQRLPAGVYSLCVRKSLLTDNGISFIEGIRSEDYDWLLSVLLSSRRIYASDHVYYVYREGRPGSVTQSIDLQHLRDLLEVAERWSHAPGVSDAVLKACLSNYAAYLYTTALVVTGGFTPANRRQAVRLLRDYRGILQGAVSRGLRFVRLFVQAFGILPAAWLLQRLYRLKLRREYKKPAETGAPSQ